jgi:hypothetical protein
MLRQLVRPRLWWWLALPVLFWQTRGFCLSTPATRIPYGLFRDGGANLVQPWGHLSVYRRMLPYYINHYRVFGLNLSPNAYGLVEVLMQALFLAVVAFYARKHLWLRMLNWQL